MSELMNEFMNDEFDFAEYCNSKKEKTKHKSNIVKKMLPSELPKMIAELKEMKNANIEFKENVVCDACDGEAAASTVFLYKEMNRPKLPNNMMITVNAPISHKYMYDLLKNICVDEDTLKYKGFYIVNYDAYKRMLHFNYDVEFLARVRTYYSAHKTQYADIDKLTYNCFIVVLSHICRSNDIEFSFIRAKYYIGRVNSKEYKYVREYKVSRRFEEGFLTPTAARFGSSQQTIDDPKNHCDKKTDDENIKDLHEVAV